MRVVQFTMAVTERELIAVAMQMAFADPRPNIVSLRNRAFVVKFNRLFRL